MIITTLNRIREHKPCSEGWTKLLKHLGKTHADDEPLPFSVILESNGLNDALWCCRAEPQYAREWRLFAVWCVRQVQRLMTDQRSIDALDVAERYANGQATDAELETARTAAGAAAWDAWAPAGAAAWDAWDAAWDAADAARTAAWAAAWAAAWDAWAAAGAAAWDAWDAAWDAADAARTAAWAAAWAAARAAAWAAGDAARGAARAAQAQEFLRIVTETEAPK